MVCSLTTHAPAGISPHTDPPESFAGWELSLQYVPFLNWLLLYGGVLAFGRDVDRKKQASDNNEGT